MRALSGRPAGILFSVRETEEETGASMKLRLLLVALLLWGTTEAAVCRAYCAHVAEFAGVAATQALEDPAPGAMPCHGHGEPSPAPWSQPQDPDGSDDTGCCPDLWFTGTEASWTAAQAPLFSVQGTFLAISSMLESGPRMLTAAVPPEPLHSPFRTQNPPLLS
jgi:hypothetical protein